jgi:MFS family permease
MARIGRLAAGRSAPDEAPGRQVAAVFLARALRDFGDAFVALLLPVYLAVRGLDAFEIGLVATLALLGSSLAALGVGFLGARVDPRSLLLAASLLMAATGLAFAAAADLALVLLVAFAGTINPSSGSVSVFVPLEHAVLARSAGHRERTPIFARYSLIGALAAAVGALAATSPRRLEASGLSALGALQAMFVIYAALGIAGGLLYARLPRARGGGAGPGGTERHAPLGPSRGIVYRLAALFSLDAFAGGFVVQSLLALWLFERFGLSLAAAGVFFFWAGIASALSFPAAAWLAARIGLVNTMVFTHIPASLLLIVCAVSPSVELALAALILRAALSQMDVPTRSSYVMAVVTPPERTAAASVTAVPRSLAAALGPALAGALLEAGRTAWPLVLCAVLKIVYDLALLKMFRGVKPPEERREAEER